jgi:hypothetical protein
MDPIVAAALKKWPNVPHCYGWLALDARGDWYMRDERIQAAGPFPKVKGSRIEHEKLREFIGRTYGVDEAGAWYFQNGPQRVYVELEAAPYVWRLAPGSASEPPAIATASVSEGPDSEWIRAMTWLRQSTPPPFASGDPYLDTPRSLRGQRSAWGVLAWWDYGYWIIEIGHRVPTANGTQAGAVDTARMFLRSSVAAYSPSTARRGAWYRRSASGSSASRRCSMRTPPMFLK